MQEQKCASLNPVKRKPGRSKMPEKERLIPTCIGLTSEMVNAIDKMTKEQYFLHRADAFRFAMGAGLRSLGYLPTDERI